MINTILFDCDGVLVNSYESTISYLQKTFKHFNLPVPPKESFLPLLGTKTPDIIRILQPQLSDDDFTKVYAFSMKESLAIVPTIQPMQHVIEILESLKKSYKLAVVSNRGRDSLLSILNNLKLTSYFSLIYGREDVTYQKPDPEPLIKAINELDSQRKQAVMIGDTAIDAASAKAAKVLCIIYNNPDLSLGDYSVTSLKEIPAIIKLL